jgi:hypothetical protein
MFLVLWFSPAADAAVDLWDTPRATDEELDRLRGGFVVDWNGQAFLMPFSIDGIERLTQINGQTYINGELAAPALNPLALIPLPNAALGETVSAGDSVANTQVSMQGHTIVIQNGAGNVAAPVLNLNVDTLGTLIQNSVDDQIIRSITTMNITIEAQMLAAQARLNSLLNQALQGLR